MKKKGYDEIPIDLYFLFELVNLTEVNADISEK